MLLKVNFGPYVRQKFRVVHALGFKQVSFYPIALVLVEILKILSKFRVVRIHEVCNSRIGHFATNTELSVLAARNAEKALRRRPLNFYCFQSLKSSNLFLEKMWRRQMFCLTGALAYAILDIAKRVEKPQIYFESTVIDEHGLLIEKKLPTLEFLNSEISTGQKFLSDCGTDRENRFVCLNVRDKTFLEKSEPIAWNRNRDWSYHDYRDSDIKTYVAAAEALAEMGYTVFRMGAIVKEPLISKHPRVIDYATNGMRTEFLDIFLGAHCAFAVSTGSGWDEVPQIFRRPVSYFNLLPLVGNSFQSRAITYFPKILLDSDSSEVLTLQQLIERGAATPLNTQAYKDAGVVIRDLSSEELVDAVTEMAQRVEGTFVETPEQKEMQAKAKHILSTHPKLQPTPNYYPIRAQFASCFLSRYPNFLD